MNKLNQVESNSEFKNAVIYARYSDGRDQNDYTLEAQIEDCTTYAFLHGYKITHIYSDSGISGRTDNRPEFKKMISDSKEGLFDAVFIWKYDRFARNVEINARYVDILEKNGVDLISVNEVVDNTPMGKFVRNLLAAWAEFYSTNLAANVKRGLQTNTKYHFFNGGQIPFGYVSVPANDGISTENKPKKKLVVDEDMRCYVEEIFQRYSDGESCKAIYDSLNERGITSTRGRAFTKASLASIFKNKIYIGYYCYSGMEIPDVMPRIISDDLFDKVQKRIEFNKQAPAHCVAPEEYLLTTKLFCGECKSKMTGRSGVSQTKAIHRYYECLGRLKTKCTTKYVKKNELENFVVCAAKSFLTDKSIQMIVKEVIALCKKENNTPKYIKSVKLLKENKDRQETLMNNLALSKIPAVTNKIMDELASLIEQQEKLESTIEIEKKRAVQITAEEIEFFLYKLKYAQEDDIKYKKFIIDNFIKKVEVYKDKIVIYFYTQEKQYVAHAEDFEAVRRIINNSSSRSAMPSPPKNPSQ